MRKEGRIEGRMTGRHGGLFWGWGGGGRQEERC